MIIYIHLYRGDQGRTYALTTQDNCLLGGHLMGDLPSQMSIPYARECIEQAKDGKTSYIGGTAACAALTAKEALVVPTWDLNHPEDYPFALMALSEYERVINIWSQFLQNGHEVKSVVTTSDELSSPDDAVAKWKTM